MFRQTKYVLLHEQYCVVFSRAADDSCVCQALDTGHIILLHTHSFHGFLWPFWLTFCAGTGENVQEVPRGWKERTRRTVAAEFAERLQGAPASVINEILDATHQRLLPEEPSVLLCQQVQQRAKLLLDRICADEAAKTTTYHKAIKSALILGTMPNKSTGDKRALCTSMNG